MSDPGTGPPPERPGLEDRAVRSVPLTVLSYLSGKLLTVGSTLVLAHLLTPKDFGVVALAGVMVGAISLLQDWGLSGVLVVRQDLERKAQGAVLTMMVAIGATVAALVAALSPLAARLFDEPKLDEVLAVLGLTALLGGVGWFYETLMQRELAFGRRLAAQVAQAVVAAVASISLAVAGAGVWSLVAGQVLGSVVYALGGMWLAPYRVRPTFDFAVARETLVAGRGFMAQGALAFLQRNTDNFGVGKLLGSAQLGFYSMAFRLAELPYWAVTEPVAQVTFAGFSRMHHDGREVAPSFLSVLRLVALVTCPMCVLLSAAAMPFTRTLLGDDWRPMAGALAVLAIWGAIVQLEATLGWLFNSLGRAGLNAAVSGAAFLLLAPGVIIAGSVAGITAVAWVMLGNVVFSLLALSWLARRALALSLREQWRAVRPVLLASPLTWLAARLVSDATDSGVAIGASLAASVGAGALVYLTVISVLEPGVLGHAARQLGRTLRREPAPAPGT